MDFHDEYYGYIIATLKDHPTIPKQDLVRVMTERIPLIEDDETRETLTMIRDIISKNFSERDEAISLLKQYMDKHKGEDEGTVIKNLLMIGQTMGENVISVLS